MISRRSWYKLHFLHLGCFFFGMLATVMTGIVTPNPKDPSVNDQVVIVFLVAFGLVVISGLLTLPAYYFDSKYLSSRSGWAPSWRLYAIIAVVGTPLLASSIYLYQRRKKRPQETTLPFVEKINWFHLILITLILNFTAFLEPYTDAELTPKPVFATLMLFVFLSPFFYYMDAQQLKENGSDYEPVWYLYAFGFIIPLIAPLMYTIQRYRHTLR
jgi:hypothetical protein